MTLKLRPYETTKTDRGVGLECPRCDGKFIVNYPRILREKADRNTSTIVCPYCSKVNAIPVKDRLDGGEPSYLSDGNPYDLEKGTK